MQSNIAIAIIYYKNPTILTMMFLSLHAWLAFVLACDRGNAATFFKSSLPSSAIMKKNRIDSISKCRNELSPKNGWFLHTDLRGGAMGKLQMWKFVSIHSNLG